MCVRHAAYMARGAYHTMHAYHVTRCKCEVCTCLYACFLDLPFFQFLAAAPFGGMASDVMHGTKTGFGAQ